MASSQIWRHIDKHMQLYASLLLSGGVCVAQIPQSLGLAKYRGILANYTSAGDEEPISETVQTMADKVFLDVFLKPEEEARIDLFTAFGHDMVHKGSCRIKTGAIIGIPSTFNFKSLTDVAKQQFQLNLQPVDWSSQGGRILMASLLLSDKAKQFAIAREIQYANTNPIWATVSMQMGCGALAYMSGFAANRIFSFKQRLKLWARAGLYGMIGVLGLGVYLMIHDTYMCARDRKADTKAAMLGLDYAEGGVEYYNQLLQRNKALYVLMGPNGPRFYTPYGNEKSTYRRSHLQCSERRDHLQRLVGDIKENPELVDRKKRLTSVRRANPFQDLADIANPESKQTDATSQATKQVNAASPESKQVIAAS